MEDGYNWSNFGRVAYDKYRDHLNATHPETGRALPDYEALCFSERCAWIEVAKEVCATFSAAVRA